MSVDLRALEGNLGTASAADLANAIKIKEQEEKDKAAQGAADGDEFDYDTPAGALLTVICCDWKWCWFSIGRVWMFVTEDVRLRFLCQWRRLSESCF